MIRYILKKDCPAAKAGATLTWDSKLGFYVYDETDSFRRGMYTHRKGEEQADVENNPSWFELIKEEPKEVFTLDDTNWQGIIYNIKKKDHPVDWLIRQLNIVLQSKQSKTPPIQSKPDTSKERIEVVFYEDKTKQVYPNSYFAATSKPIPSNKFIEINKAIESVLNNEKLYTKFDVDILMKDAFNAARESQTNHVGGGIYHFFQNKYPTLKSYLQTIKK